MTNIDLDQIVPKDMPEWFCQDAGAWKFNLPCECMDQECRSGIFLCNLPAKHPIRFLAGCVMMAYWQEKRYVCYIQPDESTEVGNKYDAAREWRDQKGE